jgi:DNA-binding MarR family transcriptional regulator
VLGIVAHRGSLGLAELTEIEGLNPTTLSRVVGKLDSFGLIRRLRDPEDFRTARVGVTPDGQQAGQQARCFCGTSPTALRMRLRSRLTPPEFLR